MNNEDKLFDLVTKMYSDMQEGFKKVNQRLNTVETELKEFREETNTNFSNLEDKLNNLEGTNATNHVAINSKLNKVSEDLDFLTHKEFQTEKEMYHIKQKLIRQRRKYKIILQAL